MQARLLSHISKLTLLQALRDAHLGLGQQADTLTSTLTVCGYISTYCTLFMCCVMMQVQCSTRQTMQAPCLDGV